MLNGDQVPRPLSMRDCVPVVEKAFRRHALGESIAPRVLGSHVDGGGFHAKTAGMLGAATGGRPDPADARPSGAFQ